VVNQKSIDALKKYQFKPGISGNPGGKPKKAKEYRQKILDEFIPVIEKHLKQAEEGNVQSANFLKSIAFPTLSAIEITDNREEQEEDLSALTDDQLKEIEIKEQEIEQIKGGKRTGNESPEA
jgi:hypothetical protein